MEDLRNGGLEEYWVHLITPPFLNSPTPPFLYWSIRKTVTVCVDPIGVIVSPTILPRVAR
jgi:hypothetical protein